MLKIQNMSNYGKHYKFSLKPLSKENEFKQFLQNIDESLEESKIEDGASHALEVGVSTTFLQP